MGECDEWHLAKDKHGYGVAHVGKKRVFAHRLAYCEWRGLSLGDISGQVVMHKCDNPSCVNPNHLKLGTQQDNMSDMADKNRSCIGQRNGRSKLTEEQCREIIRDYRPYVKGMVAEMSLKYGVSERAIRKIATGERWSYVKVKPEPGDDE